MFKRGLAALAALYITVAVVSHAQERRGAIRCDCRDDCWCKQPGLRLFRWTFPLGHSLD